MKIGIWSVMRYLIAQWDNLGDLLRAAPEFILRVEESKLPGKAKFDAVAETLMELFPEAWRSTINLAIELAFKILEWRGMVNK